MLNDVKKLKTEIDALEPLVAGMALLPDGTALLDGKIFVGSGANLATARTMSGDATIGNTGVVAIGTGVIVNADVHTNAAIAFSKLATLTDGNIVVGSGANVPTSVAVSGDVTIANTGAVTIGAKKVTAGMTAIADGKILIGGAGGAGAAQTLSGDITMTNTGVATIANAAVTPLKTIVAEARTATAAGLTTGTISDTSTMVTVTSDSADKIIILPTPTPGRVLTIINGATGYELRSSAPETVAINGGTEAGAESAIGASMILTMTCVSATAWIGTSSTAAGVQGVVQVAAA